MVNLHFSGQSLFPSNLSRNYKIMHLHQITLPLKKPSLLILSFW